MENTRLIARTLSIAVALSMTAAAPAPCQIAVDETVELTRLEGTTLRDAGQDDLRMLAIMGGAMLRIAELKGPVDADVKALGPRAMAAMQQGRPTDAFRLAIRTIVLLGGGKLSDGLEVATAYDLKINRKIVAPGQELRVDLVPLFTLGRSLATTLTARFTVYSGDEPLATLGPYSIEEIQPIEAKIPVDRLKEGHNHLWYELKDASGELLAAGYRDFILAPNVGDRIAALRAKLTAIRSMELGDPRSMTATETVEYVTDLIGRAAEGYVTSPWKRMHPMTWYARNIRTGNARIGDIPLRIAALEPFELETDLKLAETLAAAILDGKDPLEGMAGNNRLAHRSPIDGSLQPYRVYIPEDYNPAHKYPLVIGLHGASGNEDSFMRRDDFKEEARKRGYLLATPNGRGPFTGYRDAAGADVLEVLDRMLATYSIDPAQVFLTGHSMGGGGTWRVGFRAPDRFAALAPIAGAPPPKEVDFDAAQGMPVLFSAGVKDRTVSIENVRRLAEAAKRELNNLTYVEYPEDGHSDVPDSAMIPIFDFFDEHRADQDTGDDH